MILPFSTQMKGKPTYFVEKIQAGIKTEVWQKVNKINFDPIGFSIDAYLKKAVKIHTIREDKNNRWQPGKNIDFFINARQKNMFRFAPVLPVVSTQKIDITYYNELNPTFTGELSKLAKGYYNEVEVLVDGNKLTIKQIELLSLNDGFESVNDFFAYFDKDFSGKLIHWTNQEY
jgi:hypothetical protein